MFSRFVTVLSLMMGVAGYPAAAYAADRDFGAPAQPVADAWQNNRADAAAGDPYPTSVPVFGPALDKDFIDMPYTTTNSVAVVEAILAEAGISHRMYTIPWSRSLQSAKAIPNSLIFMLTRTPEREADFIWIHQHHEDRYDLIGLDGITTGLKTPADVRARKLSVPCSKDTATCKVLRDAGLEPSIEVAAKGRPMDFFVDRLLSGRIDLMVADIEVVRGQLMKRGIDPDRAGVAFAIKQADPVYLAARNDLDPRLLERLERAIERMTARGLPLTNRALYRAAHTQ